MKRMLSALAAAVALSAAAPSARAADPEIGKPAPAFTVQDVDGKARSLSDFKGKFVVLEWTNPGCPFVKKHYGGASEEDLFRHVREGMELYNSGRHLGPSHCHAVFRSHSMATAVPAPRTAPAKTSLG